ncbi:hypothetical protein IAR55_002997 [Kwoniella newhampshirensis]|uniref:C3H1-type domain-containing protein n=1 Tax=Kwoniella newhampshirensis TaxID=1651941 RepID=A0AAW0YS90_9TREE
MKQRSTITSALNGYYSPAPSNMREQNQDTNMVDLSDTDTDTDALLPPSHPQSPLPIGENDRSSLFANSCDTQWPVLVPTSPSPHANTRKDGLAILSQPNSSVDETIILLSPTQSVKSTTLTAKSSNSKLSATASPFQSKSRTKSMTVKRPFTPPSFFPSPTTRGGVTSIPIAGDGAEIQTLSPSTTGILAVEQGAPWQTASGLLTPRSSEAVRITSPLDLKSVTEMGKKVVQSEGKEKTKAGINVAVRQEGRDDASPATDDIDISDAVDTTPLTPSKHSADEVLNIYSTSIIDLSTAENKGRVATADPGSTPIDTETAFPAFPFFCFSTQPNNIPLPKSPVSSPARISSPTRPEQSLELSVAAVHQSPRLIPLPHSPENPVSLLQMTGPDRPMVSSASSAVILNQLLNTMDGGVQSQALNEAVEEVKELKELWLQLDDAHGRFYGGLEEVTERIGQSITKHTCHTMSTFSPQIFDPANSHKLEESYATRLSTLESENSSLRKAKEEVESEVKSAKAKTEQLSTKCIDAQSSAKMYKSQADRLLIDKERLNKRTEDLERENGLLEKRNSTLARDFFALQDQLEKRTAGEANYGKGGEPAFAIVLLEGEPSMFDPALLKRGHRGGSEMALSVLEKTNVLCNIVMPTSKPAVIMAQLFMDVVGSITSLTQFRQFCDGFSSQHDLCTIIDVNGPGGPSDKIKALMSLYASRQACSLIVLGAESSKRYLKYLQLCQKQGKSGKIYAVRSTKDMEDDPFLFLGQDRLLYVDQLFKIDPSDWDVQYQVCRRVGSASVVSIASTSQPTTRPLSVASIRTIQPPSPTETDIHSGVDQRYQGLRHSASTMSISSTAPQNPRIYPPEELLSIRQTSPLTSFKPPLWLRVTSSPAGPSRSETDKERVDRLLEERSTYSTIRSPSPSQVSHATTPKASRRGIFTCSSTPEQSPTRHRPQGQSIVVPIDITVDGSIGGSPPESDEDEPSVQLPHSALKHVQRPTTINNDDDITERGRSHSISVASLERAQAGARQGWKDRLVQQKRESGADRYPMMAKDRTNLYIGPVSNANKIPLGSVSSPSTQYSELGSGDRLYGFRVAGAGQKARPQSEEYRFLSNLDPKPCHHHYLEGRCPNRSCKFGHDYVFFDSEVRMLKGLAKRIKCIRSNEKMTPRIKGRKDPTVETVDSPIQTPIRVRRARVDSSGKAKAKAGPGPTSLASLRRRQRLENDMEDEEDPLAMSPIQPTPHPMTSATSSRRRTKRIPATQYPHESELYPSSPVTIPTSTPTHARSTTRSGGRVTRAAKRRDREAEELRSGDEDLIPPSEDEEYERWKERRKARLEDRVEVELVSMDEEGEEEEEVEEIEYREISVQPQKPDKDSIPSLHRTTPHRVKQTFETLLPSPPQLISRSSPFSTTSESHSLSRSTSRGTSPTQPLSFSQNGDDPFFPRYSMESESAEGRRWEESDDELDLIGQESGDWRKASGEVLTDADELVNAEGPILEVRELRRDGSIIDSTKHVGLISQHEYVLGSVPKEDEPSDSHSGSGQEKLGLQQDLEMAPIHIPMEHSFPDPATELRHSPSLCSSRSTTPQTVPLFNGIDLSQSLPGESPGKPTSIDQAGSFSSFPQTVPEFETFGPFSIFPSSPGKPGTPHRPWGSGHPPVLPVLSPSTPPFSSPPKEITMPPPRSADLTQGHLASFPRTSQHHTSPSVIGRPPEYSARLRTAQRGSSPAADLSSIFAAVANPAPVPLLQVPDSLPAADPALEQFRTARTFRTRTVLQLQPYTKERQIYEAALRKGGFKKGKKAVADAREISPNEEDKDEEGQVDESSEASLNEVESSERIVIGNAPPEQTKRARTPRTLIDADLDEYFLEHGTAPDETDPKVARELQQIAKRRMRAAKEEKKRVRDAEKEKRQFDRLMKDMHGEKTGSEESDREKPSVKTRKDPPKARATSVRRTPGGTRTYARKNKGHPQPALRSSSDSDNIPPQAFPSPFVSPAKSLTRSPTASFRSAFSGGNDIDMDIGYGQPQIFTFDEFPTHLSPSVQRDSFPILDVNRSPPIRARTVDPVSPSDCSSSGADSVHDQRKRIARRMMPAAMLKKLEAEELARQQRREEKKRRDQRAKLSPLRPGRAVIRRGAGHDTLDIAAMFSDEDNDDTPPVTPSVHGRLNSIEQPIVVSGGSDSSSEAAEDNQTEHTLARLHRGDFEGIVSGNRWKPTEPKKPVDPRHKHRSSHSRRPALGLVKRVRASLSEGNRAMVQTRIDFPTLNKSPAPSTKKRKRNGQSRKSRPAIRLDDHVIFATADFEFESQDDLRPILPGPAKVRTFARTQSRSLPALPAAPAPDFLDTGIGKARSWANFDRFPIDFDITPLPSGLYCEENSVPGSGHLKRLVGQLRNDPSTQIYIENVSAYGIDLKSDTPPASVQEVVNLVFDSVYRQLVTIANEDSDEILMLGPFTFFGTYISSRRHHIVDNLEGLRSDLADAVRQLNLKLNSINVDRVRARAAKDAMLRLRWSIFEIVCCVSNSEAVGGEAQNALIQDCASAVLCQLLSGGFDKTIRPLKLIMRGESDSAEISDLSVTVWISLIHSTSAWDEHQNLPEGSTFLSCLHRALDQVFYLDQTGPIAAERIWFLIFGLCALSQFDVDGKISSVFISAPRWSLVRRAVGLIKVAFDEEAEKKAKSDQLQGRDRYVKVMMARCVWLSAVWSWSFDRESFSVATRDLGVIFKNRQYRNLPTEPSVDYPSFITRFDMSLTAAEDTKRETAFELYLRLVCVAASDIISAAQSLSEAQQAERDVQRLVMSIIPVSAVKFNRIFPPSAKDLGQLINRYSTMIAACYFSPSLLTYLLANSRKWSLFEQADLDSRQICIRGLMYLAVACRHHRQALTSVVDRFAEILGTLQGELEKHHQPSTVAPALAPGRLEIERTMVLVVTCFQQIIKHHSFDVQEQAKPVYPDPSLLHESWTIHIFDLELAKDLKCGLEVIATIQAFLDTRASALPRLARQRREAKEKDSHQSESMDEFGSLGIDFNDVDMLALGGEVEGREDDPVEKQDKEFADIIENVLSPKIYRLLSDMLPPVAEDNAKATFHDADRHMFISKLTKCWSDCAAVLVVEHQKLDWSTFISPFGRQSWARLGDEKGRVQVGLHFMLNVAQLDPGSFVHYDEDFVALFFQVIGTDKLTVEHKFFSSLLLMPGAMEDPLLAPLKNVEPLERELDRSGFMEIRGEVLQAIFGVIPDLLRSGRTPASTKSFVYRCINLLVSSLVSYNNSIEPSKVIHKESYHAFVITTIRDLTRLAGEFMTASSVPALKQLL